MALASSVLAAAVSPARVIPETIPQAELNTLKSFVETRGIPWEAKAVTLLAAKPEGLPAPVLKALNSLAGALIPQVQEGVVPKAEQNASIPIKDETLPVTLKQLAATVLSSAKTSDMNVLNDVAKAGPLPWNVKMLSLIMSAGKQSVPQELMKNAEEILIKTMLSMTSASENLASGATGITESVSGRAAIARASAGLKQLENLLGSIALQDGAQPNTAALKDLIKGSGLMWEAKLKTLFSGARFQTGNPLYDQSPEQLISKDMKALAMKLAEMVSRDDTDISRAVRSFADGLEKMQLLNTHSADESGRYLLPLPFFSDEELRLGQLLIELDRDSDNASGDRKKMVRVAVILEMSELGHLRADVTVYKKSINAWFGLETPGVKTVIDEALPDLKAKFEEIGYQVKSLGTKVMGQEALAGMTLTERLHDRDDSVLNIVI